MKTTFKNFALFLIITHAFLVPIVLFIPTILEINPIRIVDSLIFLISLYMIIANWKFTKIKPIFLILMTLLLSLGISIFYLQQDLKAALSEIYIFLIYCSFTIIVEYLESNSWILLLSMAGAFSGVISILTYLQIIQVPDYRLDLAPNLAFSERTASIVDGVIGLVGAASSLLFIRLWNRFKIIGFCFFLLSITNVVLGQFRTYMLMLLIIVTIWILKDSSNLFRKAKLIFLVLLILLLAYWLDPGQRFSSALSRYFESKDSDSYVLRSYEFQQEITIISENPFSGLGWGLSSKELVGDLAMYGHNMYTSWPARIGIPFFVFILMYYFSIIKNCYLNFKYSKNYGKHIHFMGLILIFCFLGVSFFQDISKMSLAFPLFSFFWTFKGNKGKGRI